MRRARNRIPIPFVSSRMDDIRMIEHLARKMCALRGIPADDHHPDFGTQWRALAREAKGVLIAIREPTDTMAAAGAEASGLDEAGARSVYGAMIGAAIARQI
jgi:hypothetical protein